MKIHRTSSACDAAGVTARSREAGFALEATQAAGLATYLELLMQWNRAMNLVGARSWEDALDRLVCDSFELADFLRQEVMPALSLPADSDHSATEGTDAPLTWDLGAGAGLPGIPLRLVWQAGTYWLVEAREKRALFLATALARLSLPRTKVFRGRVEAFMPGRLADIILSRAFMPWREVLRLVGGHLKPGGQVVLLTKEPITPEPGWHRTASRVYGVGGDLRYFCALAGLPINAPN